jgi:recombination protein RecT
MSTVVTSKEDQTLARLLSHMAAVRAEWESVVWMKQALKDDDSLAFLEVWMDLSHDLQIKLWQAPSKGGIWTTREREKIREWESEVRL